MIDSLLLTFELKTLSGVRSYNLTKVLYLFHAFLERVALIRAHSPPIGKGYKTLPLRRRESLTFMRPETALVRAYQQFFLILLISKE